MSHATHRGIVSVQLGSVLLAVGEAKGGGGQGESDRVVSGPRGGFTLPHGRPRVRSTLNEPRNCFSFPLYVYL